MLTLVLTFVLLALSVPISFVLAAAPIPALLLDKHHLAGMVQAISESLDSFTLLAIPFYVLAGRLMVAGGIAERLIELAYALVGWMRGGLPAAAILAAMLFATMSGSSSATAAAIGAVLIPEMAKRGYPKAYASSVVASSAELGVIIPPSIPMVVYGVVVQQSISDLFLAAIIPGLLIGATMILFTIVQSTLRGYGDRNDFDFPAVMAGIRSALRRSALSLGTPILVLGGIYGGIFTATEAAAVAALYTFLLGSVVYRRLDMRTFFGILRSTGETSAVILVIAAFASVFAFALTTYQIPQALGRHLTTLTQNPFVFLALVNVALLVVGCFLESIAAIIVLAPVLAVAAAQFGVHPIHFGIIMVVNLAIGMVTPPVGINLFVTCGITGLRIEELMPYLFPLVGMLVLALLAITYFPPASLVFLN
jgi:tripartite ATP-independent transporter DctM subunit